MKGPLVFGILNLTPDSFSDGGRFAGVDDAVAAGMAMWEAGADVLDLGGESTRPGAATVPPEVQVERVLPVLRRLRALAPSGAISLDTRSAAVASAALEVGIQVVNDVSGLEEDALAALVAASGVEVVLMHSTGPPDRMMENALTGDVVGQVRDGLRDLAERALARGVRADRIRLDPGLGFGKRGRDNAQLVAAVPTFAALGYPVLVGASRKRFVGEITGIDRPEDRAAGSVGAALAAAAAGAWAVRVHDVAMTRQALDVFRACRP